METINHPVHAFLSVITGGLWLISWAAICVGKIRYPWRCEHCGWHKPEFDKSDTMKKPADKTNVKTADKKAETAPARQKPWIGWLRFWQPAPLVSVESTELRH